MHAEKCPICRGTGIIVEEGSSCWYPSKKKTCHGCDGKGWIEVRDRCDYPYKLIAPYYIPSTTIVGWTKAHNKDGGIF